MVRNEVKRAIKALARDELTEEEFKQRLNELKTEEGGNWFTVSGAISGSLSKWRDDEFGDRVKRLAVDADERFANNLGINLQIHILSVNAYVQGIPGFDEFIEQTDNWAEGRVNGILKVLNRYPDEEYQHQIRIHHTRGDVHRVPYGDLTRVMVPDSSVGSMQIRVYVRNLSEDAIPSRAVAAEPETNDGEQGYLLSFSGVDDMISRTEAKHGDTGMTVTFADGESIEFDTNAQIDSAWHSTLALEEEAKAFGGDTR